jgi:hypothetical protein
MTCIILSIAMHNLIPSPDFSLYESGRYVEYGRLATDRKASSAFFNPALMEWKAAKNGLKIVSQKYRKKTKNAQISDRIRIARNTFLSLLSSLSVELSDQSTLVKLNCDNDT